MQRMNARGCTVPLLSRTVFFDDVAYAWSCKAESIGKDPLSDAIMEGVECPACAMNTHHM